ncbi:hypothetical protein [Sphingobacterium sp. LRF_L2]|uniref:hypothetical protein n=1 Tax=Sphingobacterium sp. LRF_L2 TaxID=3369421 RepID=UPI003F64854B
MSTTTKKASRIIKAKTIQQVNRELVMRKLNITEEVYFNMMLDAGTEYLTDVLLSGWPVGDISGTELYWKWWYNHWHQWDAQFLTESRREKKELHADLYMRLHDASDRGYFPNKEIMDTILRRRHNG